MPEFAQIRPMNHAEAHELELSGPRPVGRQEGGLRDGKFTTLSARRGLTVSTCDFVNRGALNGEVVTQPCAALIYLFNGSGDSWVLDERGRRGGVIPLRPGRFYVSYYRYGVRGENQLRPDTRVQSLDIRMDLSIWDKMSGGIGLDSLTAAHPFHCASGPDFWTGLLPVSPDLRHTARFLYDKAGASENDLIVEAKSLELVNSAVQLLTQRLSGLPRMARDRQVVERVRELIAAQLERSWTVAELATAAGVSLKRLKTVFPAHTGLPVFEYLQEQRLERACALLRSSGEPVTGIALSVGYSSISHFSALFRRRYGQSPTEFRRQAQR